VSELVAAWPGRDVPAVALTVFCWFTEPLLPGLATRTTTLRLSGEICVAAAFA
jgi:hypothetical protein